MEAEIDSFRSADGGSVVVTQYRDELRTDVGPADVGVVHQALRREVNEQIAKLGPGAADDGSAIIEVVCECAYSGCAGHVVVSLEDYEGIRRFPTRFLVKAGHEVAEHERVVADSDAYVIVEKVGQAGIEAVHLDPRRRSVRGAGIARS